MKLEQLDVAQNGFVAHDSNGNMYVAKSITELAGIVGEGVTIHSGTGYAAGFGSNDLGNVKYHFRAGRKIEAIKLIRDCFTPRLGLREAKDLVEQLCG